MEGTSERRGWGMSVIILSPYLELPQICLADWLTLGIRMKPKGQELALWLGKRVHSPWPQIHGQVASH